MPPTSPKLLDITKGAVVAPAGCGKTHLIAEALASHTGPKPVLVLTHTNAGVAALRLRLARAGVRTRSYRISTIDGWALRLASTFPQGSGVRPDALLLKNLRRDYPDIRAAALRLLASGHIADILRSTYDHIVVDEYQDCSRAQHAMVKHASDSVATAVLGDPMQSIFGFGTDPLAEWEADVCTCFPIVATLQTPWRWLNVNEGDLGEWLLYARTTLINRSAIDLQNAPSAVSWIELDGVNNRQRQLRAAQTPAPSPKGDVLILADSRRPDEQRSFASQIIGAATVEAVDLRDFIAFADGLDFERPDVLQHVVLFAESVMANVGRRELLARVDSLERGTARKAASDVEAATLRLKASPSFDRMAELLDILQSQGGVRVYRPAVLRACFRALRRCGLASGLTFGDAARAVREEQRAGTRVVARRAVGSTLLMKGLEADMAVILDASEMDAHHLYVAMTRGARKLIVCSSSARLSPA